MTDPSFTPVIENVTTSGTSDRDLEALLRRVYVDDGYTDPEVASTVFVAAAVRARGEMLVAKDERGTLFGMVIMVPPSSPARRLATTTEAEMHLLAVSPERRGRGLGRALVDHAVALAERLGCTGMVLWTQSTMVAAHRLYEAAGFSRRPERDFERGGRPFLVFERALGPGKKAEAM